MAVEFSCKCGKKLRAPDHLLGKKIRCPACGDPVSVGKLVSATAAQSPKAYDPFADLPALGNFSNQDFGQPSAFNQPYSGPSPRLVRRSGASFSFKPLLITTGIFSAIIALVGCGWLVISIAPKVAAMLTSAGHKMVASASNPSSNVDSSNSTDPSVVARDSPSLKASNLSLDVNEAEAMKAAEAYVASIQQGNFQEFSKLFDLEGLVHRALDQLEVSQRFRTEFTAGALQSTGAKLFNSLSEVHNGGGSITVLRPVMRGGQQRVIVRLKMPDGGLGYQELIFHRTAQNFVRVHDLFVLLTDETLQETFRRGALLAESATNRSLLDRLTGANNDLVKHGKELSQLPMLVKAQPQRVIDLYHSFPDSLKKMRYVALMRMTAAAELDEAEYLAAIQDIRALIGNSPAADLHSLDFFFIRKEFDQCLAAGERLQTYLGGDPELKNLLDEIRELAHQ